jgi:predicted MFS family arabinose efflux permease
MAAAVLFYAFGLGLYLPLLYVYALELGASRFDIGLLAAVGLATTALSSLPGAWAAARFRLKPVIAWVWWLVVVAGLCYVLAPTWQWLVPGLVLTGLSMANNPAMKAYVHLKSDDGRVARSMTLVYGSVPLGLIVSPLLGGYLADVFGMRTVFALSTVLYVVSALAASLLRDTPYHAPAGSCSLRAATGNRPFRRYVLFFLLGYLAVYVAQAFLTPYLAQVHDQGKTALGIYASLAAAGAAAMTPLWGRVADLRGGRLSIAGVLVLVALGCVLLLAGGGPAVWALAMFCCGSFDALRFVTNGIVCRSFGEMPLAWGYAVFDTAMGLPMAGGALLGGLLYQMGYALPFVFAIAVAGVLLVVLAVVPGDVACEETGTGT